MFLFVLALLLLAAGVVLFGVAHWFKKRQSAEAKRRTELLESRKQSRGSSSSYDDDYYDRMSNRGSSSVNPSLFRYIGSGAIVVAIICAFFSSFTTVPTKDIGVTTAFGAPTGYLTNGAHFIAPWESVNLMDGAIQTDTHNSGDKSDNCIQVRIAHQIVACANMYVKWQVNEPAVDELYRNYREFSNVRDSLVDKNLQAVLNHVFESYDPLAVDADGNATAPQLSVLSQQALTQMQTSVGDQISIQALNVTVLNYDPAAQKKIDALQAQVAQTRIAQQAIKTAENQAKANDTLAKSVSNNPEVLVSNCLDSLNEAISKGYQLPAGFSCWPGNSSVVIPGINGSGGK